LESDFLTAKGFVFEGDMMFMLDGDRGISGDTAFGAGAIAAAEYRLVECNVAELSGPGVRSLCELG
jgi:hypothetical protein